MFITNVLVTGTVAYAGVKTVLQHQVASQRAATPDYAISNSPRKAPHNRSATVDGAKTNEANVRSGLADVLVHGAPTLQERRQKAAAATAFWLGVGGLVWSPLTLIGVPLTIYSSFAIFEAAGRSLYAEGKLRPSVINSILLVSTLVTERYLPAAAISWLHHSFKQIGQRIEAAGEQISSGLEPEVVDLLRQAMGGSPQMVWVERGTGAETSTGPNTAQEIEMKIPFGELRTGDLLVANRGEFIPVNGLVMSGEATLNLLLLTRSGTPMAVGTGDRVYRGAFVTEGRLRIKVDPLQAE